MNIKRFIAAILSVTFVSGTTVGTNRYAEDFVLSVSAEETEAFGPVGSDVTSTTTTAKATSTTAKTTTTSTTTAKTAAASTTKAVSTTAAVTTVTSTTSAADIKDAYEYGDVNNSGTVDAVDASAILSYYALVSTSKDGKFSESQLKAADVNNDGTVNAVDASCILAYYAYASTAEGNVMSIADFIKKGSEKKPNLFGYLYASPWAVKINSKETVKFTVNVNSEEELGEKKIALYDDSDNMVSYMFDDGTNGDEKANDGTYTADVAVSSDEMKDVNYYASLDKEKSEPFEVFFYREHTQEDFDNFDALYAAISELAYEEACEYVKNSEEILEYNIDAEERSITYTSKYGITGMWEEKIEENDEAFTNISICGRGKNSIPDEVLKNYNMYDRLLNYIRGMVRDCDIVPEEREKNDIILFRSEPNYFKNDRGKDVAEILQSVTGGKVDMFDEEDFSLDTIDKIPQYGTVIIEAHGGKDSFLGTSIHTGQKWRAKLEHSPYYWKMMITVDGKGNFAVRPGYFEKRFKPEDFKDSIWFMSCCHGMSNDMLPDALLSRGAETVVGSTDSVTDRYFAQMLIDTVCNGMILSANTLKDSIADAKKIYGYYDPYIRELEEYYDVLAFIKVKGNEDFRYVKSVSGPDWTNYFKSFASWALDNYIVFPTVDSGKNTDPRIPELIRKIDEGLSSTYKHYICYGGDMAIDFGGRIDAADEMAEASQSLQKVYDTYLKHKDDKGLSRAGMYKYEKKSTIGGEKINSNTEIFIKHAQQEEFRDSVPFLESVIQHGGMRNVIVIIKDDYYESGIDFDNAFAKAHHRPFVIDLREEYDHAVSAFCKHNNGRYLHNPSDEDIELMTFIINKQFEFKDSMADLVYNNQ